MNKETVLTVFIIFILLFTSCKTFKKDCNDCPNFGTNPVKKSETNSPKLL